MGRSRLRRLALDQQEQGFAREALGPARQRQRSAALGHHGRRRGRHQHFARLGPEGQPLGQVLVRHRVFRPGVGLFAYLVEGGSRAGRRCRRRAGRAPRAAATPNTAGDAFVGFRAVRLRPLRATARAGPPPPRGATGRPAPATRSGKR
ncbi:hypothetical protein ACRAWF_02610 [Streptomyces sp. L7]